MADESVRTRTYRKRKRADQEADTRMRITEAAVKLHGTVGPAKTTVSAIAKEAGVQRATVYRHFPDEAAIYNACTSHYNSLHPPPNPEPWAEIADHDERLRVALGEVYAFYEETHQMLESTGRDAERVPAVAQQMEMMVMYLDFARSVLVKGRPQRGAARARVTAAIGHALAFTTWRSLVREQGLSDEDAAALMEDLVSAAS